MDKIISSRGVLRPSLNSGFRAVASKQSYVLAAQVFVAAACSLYGECEGQHVCERSADLRQVSGLEALAEWSPQLGPGICGRMTDSQKLAARTRTMAPLKMGEDANARCVALAIIALVCEAAHPHMHCFSCRTHVQVSFGYETTAFAGFRFGVRQGTGRVWLRPRLGAATVRARSRICNPTH